MQATSGTNLDAVRRHNLGTVLRHLHQHGAVTRAELTALTGLNRSTIAGLVDDLEARGTVSLGAAVSRGAPGRPSPLITPRADRFAVLALEIAVDSVAAAVVGLGGDVLARHRIDRARGPSTADTTIATVTALGRELLDGLHPAPSPYAVGVSVVGVVRPEDGLVRIAPNLGWHDVPLAERVAGALDGSPIVRVGNDGDLGALAEHRRGVGVGCSSLLYLSGEVGIGGGVISGGQLLAGAGGSSGEVGHMLVNPRGRACRCGATGCWETEAAAAALLRRARHPGDGGPQAVREVLAGAAAGGRRPRAAVAATARWLGLGIGSLVNVLDVERVVLGSVFAAVHDLAADVIVSAAGDQALAPPPGIVAAALGVDAPLLGAAERAFEPALADPTILPTAA